ncbi:hypothetical protein BKA57DRAFT_470403 [Linnemannia elongata]|nr:hypothetical protein BKA57DRAFT_470403 [Linnemannia elongata]
MRLHPRPPILLFNILTLITLPPITLLLQPTCSWSRTSRGSRRRRRQQEEQLAVRTLHPLSRSLATPKPPFGVRRRFSQPCRQQTVDRFSHSHRPWPLVRLGNLLPSAQGRP